jgi:hypothetical protein
MENCTFCGAETTFLNRGFPICLNCLNQRVANAEPTEAQKLQELLARYAAEDTSKTQE